MNTPVTGVTSPENNTSYDAGRALKPVLVRLENIVATTATRKRIEDRVRELNRTLEDCGAPFRMRLL